MIVPGKAEKKGTEAKCNILIGQPHFIIRYGILVGRTLVDISQDDVAVMLLNPLDEDVQLYPEMRIATCEPIESWEKAP